MERTKRSNIMKLGNRIATTLVVGLVFVPLASKALWSSDRVVANAQEVSRGGNPSAFVVNWLGPVGVARGQTARLNILNASEERGIIIDWKILDAGGNTLAESDGRVVVAVGHTESFDVLFADGHLTPRTQLRAVVRAIGNPRNQCALHTTLEVIDNNTLRTSTFVGPAAVKGCSNNL
jgi:prepilin-type processing-associated H-X9-DG protein